MANCKFCGKDSRTISQAIGFCGDCIRTHFYLSDLPTTSRSHALRCKAAAERAGLRRVHIGNLHLLGEDY